MEPGDLPPATLVRSLGLHGRCVVADVGTGTGALLGAIRSAAPAARVVALDASAGMLHLARTRRGASAVIADALALPLTDGIADAVILAYVLFHLPDPARAVAEAARVLPPGARVGTITWAWERGSRADVLARAKNVLSQLAPQDFLWEGEVICAVATKDTTARYSCRSGGGPLAESPILHGQRHPRTQPRNVA